MPQSSCIFEHVYFSRPDSVVFGQLGQREPRSHGPPVGARGAGGCGHRSSGPGFWCSRAIGYSQESGLPFRTGLIRSHYVGRTFIEPGQRVRDFAVRLKLNPVRSVISGKRVILIDDSIVRGTTSRKLVRLLRSAGAKEVHMRISCPPHISPCYYGVDTPDKQQLIAANKSVEQIREYAGLRHACLSEPGWLAPGVRRRGKNQLLHILLHRY